MNRPRQLGVEVLNQYQRRNDLIPNVVNSVKGEADFEKSTLTQVINARAKATSIQATPELMENPEAFLEFTQAQGELSSALSRLLVTVERYPDLKANKAFQDLRVQLEGCENRIAIAFFNLAAEDQWTQNVGICFDDLGIHSESGIRLQLTDAITGENTWHL